jgi:hypothetical protein
MNQPYKFPDETEDNTVEIQASDDDFEIEIVDDTPEKDRGRQPLNKEVLDPTDDEIANYSQNVQSRIKELTHARHDERRKAEAIERERQELEKLTQQLIQENNNLKNNVNAGQEMIVSSAKQKAEADLVLARKQYKEAQEAYDTDAIIAAQEALTEAKMRFEQVKNYRHTPLQNVDNDVQTQPRQTQQVRPDEKSLRWQAKNQWFGSNGFEEVTSYALGLHQKLVNSGIDPRSDEYYQEIDSRVHSKFPEVFGEPEKTPAQTAKRPSNVVAPATRSSGVKKVQLTPTQAALVKKFNLDPKKYYLEQQKLEKQNG